MTPEDRRTPETTRLVVLIVASAVLLRLVLLLGRGDYLAFDEGWYLLLARSLYTGEGYSLVGFPHTALSPLFPILAGAAGVVMDSWVWGGRIVAAVAAGLVALPAWAVFRRLAPERTALIATALVAVLPSLAPFVVPFWIGADLWVGAEPLLHLFLYTGIALWLKADALHPGAGRGGSEAMAASDDEDEVGTGRNRPTGAPIPRHRPLLTWLLAGGAFGLAFLARPEAIITWGLLGLVALGLAAATRSPRRLAGAALMGVGFLVLAAPYWVYVHDVTGEWTLTGRGVSLPSVAVDGSGGATRSGASRAIERMLWEDDVAYRERLYGLDETGLRLRASYWGVQPPEPGSAADVTPDTSGPGTDPDTTGSGTGADTAPSGAAPGAAGTDDVGAVRRPGAVPLEGPSPVALYVESMGQVFPLLLWLFAVLGAAQPRSRSVLRRELPVTGALLGTSVAIAVVVAVDPRTQLFLAPLLALYAARGFRLVEDTLSVRWTESPVRPGFVELLLAMVAVVWLLAIDGRRLYLSLSLGSPHHIVAHQNRGVANDLDELLDWAAGPVASWHPAIAVYADRDWRVLPFADLPGIVRYLDAAGAGAMVLSAYYPPDLGVEDLNTRYLILPVPEAGRERRPWRLRLLRGDTIRAVGRLEPAGNPGPDEEPSR